MDNILTVVYVAVAFIAIIASSFAIFWKDDNNDINNNKK